MYFSFEMFPLYKFIESTNGLVIYDQDVTGEKQSRMHCYWFLQAEIMMICVSYLTDGQEVAIFDKTRNFRGC